MDSNVAVIIPARNEESPLPGVLAEIPQTLADTVIVVDNGSTDRTAEVSRLAGATLVSEPRAGYGYAWWDVPVAEVSNSASVQKARENYMEQKKKQRYYL